MQAIQQQIQGASSPWNVGAAYRVPDSNINLSCTYQQGRANVQVSFSFTHWVFGISIWCFAVHS
jgi:hypothetical protein